MKDEYQNDYLSRYVAKLRRKREERIAERAVAKRSLADQIREWYTQLPPWEKGMAFSMTFMVNRFGYPPSVIGPVLHQLGWQRTRTWGNGPYRRKWVPPSEEQS